MRTTTTDFDTAKNKTGSEPVWLLQLDSGGSTYYYSDRAVTVGAQTYAARVLSWGTLSGVNKRMAGGGVVNNTAISLTEKPSSISSQVKINNECRIYLWFEGESLTDTLLMFKGTITDPIEVTEQSLTFRVEGYEESRNKVVGDIITTTEFSGAGDYAVGKIKPIIYGQVYDHECLPVDAGSITTLTADIDATSTAAIAVTDTASFPTSGAIWIEAEKVTYTGKTSTTFTGIARGASSTTATAHNRGAYVVEDQTNYDYIIAGHSCQTPTAVYINGVALSSGWSKVASGGNDLLRITDGEALREALRGGVSDDLGVTPTTNQTSIVEYEAISGLTGSYLGLNGCSTGYNTCSNCQGENGYFTADSSITFSSVSITGVYENISALSFAIYTGPSYTYEKTFWVFNIHTTSQPAMRSGSIALTLSANADITKVRLMYAKSLPSGDCTNWSAICSDVVRTAEKTLTLTTEKDDYAYATGITTTENLQGARVSVDTIGYNYSRPDEIVEHLLLNYGNNIVAGDLDTSVTANTDYSTNYPMGFALTQQYDLKTLCRQIAYQCASRFFWDSGKAYLQKIPESATVSTPTGWAASSGMTVLKDTAAGNSVKLTGAVDDYIECTLATGAVNLDVNLDFWIKTDGTAQIQAKIIEDAGYGAATYAEAAWTAKNLIINNNNGTVKIRFTIKSAAGTVWIDDLVDSGNNYMERFIDWTDGGGFYYPTNWTYLGSSPEKDVKRDGAYSVKLYAKDFQTLSKQVATGQSGTSVNFKYLIKTSNSYQVSIVHDGGSISGTRANTDWQVFTTTGHTVNGDVDVRIEIFSEGFVWIDSMLWDEVSLNEDFSSWTAGTVNKVLTPDDISYQTMRMHWTPNADIINSIDAQYDLRQREYLAVESDSDSTSITTYGTRDGSHKMKLDFVNNPTCAASVVDDFILKFKEPKRVVEFSTPLQNIELQRGDIVAITHSIDGGWTSKFFEILETHVTIGNTSLPDSIRFKAEEI